MSNPSSYEVTVDKIGKSEWSDLIHSFSDSSIYQTWSMGEDKWGELNLSHLILYENGESVAAAQVGIKKLPVINGGIATVYWGPMWRKKNKNENYAILEQIIADLVHEYADKRGYLLRIWPTGFETLDDKTITVLQQLGFKRNQKIQAYRTLILDLSPTLEELRMNFGPKWRNKLNIALRNDLVINEGSTNEFYLTFLTLLYQTLSRKKFESGVDYETYRHIQNDLPDSLKMKIIVCIHDKEPVSSAVFSTIGETCTYLLGATGDKGLKANGAYLIQWAAIKWLKEKGCKWYDLGGIDPICNPGVYQFKLGIAGKTGKEVVHFGQYYLSKTLAGHLLNALINTGRIVQRILRHLRKFDANA